MSSMDLKRDGSLTESIKTIHARAGLDMLIDVGLGAQGLLLLLVDYQ